MAEAGSYYDILGVSRDADAKAIKEAFRRLTLETHPDRSDAPDAEERYRKITEAYGVLSDPDKRARYDAQGRAGVADLSAEDLVGGIDLGDLFGLSGLGGSLFERLFADARSARGRRGDDVELRVRVPLEVIAEGGAEEIRLEHAHACPTCRGDGRLLQVQRRGMTVVQQLVRCPDCGGRGQVDSPRTLALEIPPGLSERATLRLAGQGLPSPLPGGRPGDLFVVVESRPDPRFVRRGANLRRTEALEAPAFVLGTRVEVPTLDGAVIVTVPPRTAPGSVLRVVGKGLPHYRSERVGDLEVELELRLAEDLTDEEMRLYERLGQLAECRAAGEPAPEEQVLVPQTTTDAPSAGSEKQGWWWRLQRWFGRWFGHT